MFWFLICTCFFQILNIDVGIVGYFEHGCPQGLQPFLSAKGRFILSANEIYLSGSTGGTANVTLTVNNLPSHTHSLTADGRHGAYAAYAADLYSSWIDMYHEPRTKQTSATGNNQPFTIIPPYVVLIACKKVNATRVNCSQVTTGCDLPRFLNIESSLTQQSRRIFQLEKVTQNHSLSLIQEDRRISQLEKVTQNQTLLINEFLNIESSLNQESRRISQLEKTIQNQTLIINELSRYNITTSNSLEIALSQVESLSNKQIKKDNGAQLGLSIGAVILSAMALIMECYRLVKR